MTSPALVVLFLALVCSTSGITLEQTADHGSTRNNVEANFMKPNHEAYDEIDDTDLKMETSRTNLNNFKINKDKYLSNNEINDEFKFKTKDSENKFDELYTGAEDLIITNLNIHRMNLEKINKHNEMRQYDYNYDHIRSRRVKRDDDSEANCEPFKFYGKEVMQLKHPQSKNSKNNYYSNSTSCETVINATEGSVIQLTFVDMFHIEYHPECDYDFLEIRDGLFGYARLLAKVCGESFPSQITSSGPNVWMKFKSDDTIEYEGFHIDIKFLESATSHSIPQACYKRIKGRHGTIDTKDIDQECLTGSLNQALDVLWTIETPENTKIYLNFTSYQLAKPNECEDNVVQVFGSVLEFHAKLAHYCGSVPNSVTTKEPEAGKASNEKGNIMYVRLFATKSAKSSEFSAVFTAFRTLNPNKDEKCNEYDEFDCQDNTCIASELKCDKYAHCRLKADEEYDLCKGETESVISQPHILVILIIFSLILSGMSFVFLFKCIRKLYQDHKIIKEHIRQSCEDRLDSLVGSRLTLDAKRLQMDSEPRASLERENHTNEMFKQQRKFSEHKPSSIDSDFIQETHLDLDDEPWRRDVNSVPVQTEDVRIEKNGRTRRSMSRKEHSTRSRSTKGSDENRQKKEIRDVSVGAPDTKESGCQTRESLFQAGTAPSSEGTGSDSNSRGFSTFGYSGATIARPSPPAPVTNTSEITIELLRQVPTHQDSAERKSQKKISDRRPMSTETTRSAPDVIIVSKPIR